LPLQTLLASFGVSFELHPPLDGAQVVRHVPLTLGVRIRDHERECVVMSVYDDGPAQNAGLSAGDVLVALDGLRITAENLPGLLDRYSSGQVVRIEAFRRDELMSFALTLTPESTVRCVLGTQNKGGKQRRAWLGVPDPVKVESKVPKNKGRSSRSGRSRRSQTNIVS
jgi:predicted metalloprotease with PDZ domain